MSTYTITITETTLHTVLSGQSIVRQGEVEIPGDIVDIDVINGLGRVRIVSVEPEYQHAEDSEELAAAYLEALSRQEYPGD